MYEAIMINNHLHPQGHKQMEDADGGGEHLTLDTLQLHGILDRHFTIT